MAAPFGGFLTSHNGSSVNFLGDGTIFSGGTARLIPLLRRGIALDVAFEIAQTLHSDSEDLIQKAVGWALREAGKADAPRLEQYLRATGPNIPRTTVRYAIERFPIEKRQALLEATRAR